MKKETYQRLRAEADDDAAMQAAGGYVRPTGHDRGTWRKNGRFDRKGRAARRRAAQPAFVKPWERPSDPVVVDEAQAMQQSQGRQNGKQSQFEQQLAAHRGEEGA